MCQSLPIPISGSVAPGFERVLRAFERNFRETDEIGAACAMYHRGEKVVDLWGGFRDQARTSPWEQDTLVLAFSTTKGMAAIAVAVALSRRLFELDQPVCTYWPEFAQQGKEAITVRQLLSHQAGLCVIDAPINADLLADLDRLAEVLARQSPAWPAGQRQGYHYLSLGLYENELIRRTDPRGRSLGTFLREEICQPLGIEFHIGLPSDFPCDRIAPIHGFKKSEMMLHLNKMPAKLVLSLMCPRSLTARTLLNPHLNSPADLDAAEYRAVEVPGACGIGSASSLAKAYGEIASGGRVLGLSQQVIETLHSPASPPPSGYRDAVMKIDMSFALGFMKPFPSFRFGSSDTSFGCPGAGGSFAFADPDLDMGFAYVMNKMGFHVFDDPRERALRNACYECLSDL
ncbi:MAG: beta-lactamase family protein [Pirellulaceae bacterium]|nr:beta-lactamase family protein [Pirellulaceae bacterium]